MTPEQYERERLVSKKWEAEHWQRGKKKKKIYQLAVLLIFALGVFAAIQIHRFYSNPIVGGVGIRVNKESKDYTLISYDLPSGKAESHKYFEWVIRLPKDAHVYGYNDTSKTEIWSGEVHVAWRNRKNQSLATSLKFDDFSAIQSGHITLDEKGMPYQNAISLSFDGDRNSSLLRDIRRSFESECIATGNRIGGLQEYKKKPQEKYAGRCGDVSYVMWSAENPSDAQVTIECRFSGELLDHDFSSCRFYFGWRGRVISGDYPTTRLEQASDYFKRLGKFVDSITLADRPLGDVAFIDEKN
jgi:hypothetical protein